MHRLQILYRGWKFSVIIKTKNTKLIGPFANLHFSRLQTSIFTYHIGTVSISKTCTHALPCRHTEVFRWDIFLTWTYMPIITMCTISVSLYSIYENLGRNYRYFKTLNNPVHVLVLSHFNALQQRFNPLHLSNKPSREKRGVFVSVQYSTLHVCLLFIRLFFLA